MNNSGELKLGRQFVVTEHPPSSRDLQQSTSENIVPVISEENIVDHYYQWDPQRSFNVRKVCFSLRCVITTSDVWTERNGLKADCAGQPPSPRFSLLCYQRAWSPGLFFGICTDILQPDRPTQSKRHKQTRKNSEVDNRSSGCFEKTTENYQLLRAEMRRGALLPTGPRSWDFYVKLWEVRTQRAFTWTAFCLSWVNNIWIPNLVSYSSWVMRPNVAFQHWALLPQYRIVRMGPLLWDFQPCPITLKSIRLG